jgi:hypothetical protein
VKIISFEAAATVGGAEIMYLDMETSSQVNARQGDKCVLYDRTVLQGLDQWLPDDTGHVEGTFYPVDAFRDTIKRWGDTVPVIYSKKHIEPKEYPDFPKKDRDEALKSASTDDLKARIVGQSRDAELIEENTGRPHIRVGITVCDSEVNDLWKEGKLGISSAFTCKQTEDGKKVTGDVEPHHILLFPRDALRGAEQRDLVAAVNTLPGGQTNVGTPAEIYENAEDYRQKGKIHDLIQDVMGALGKIRDMIGPRPGEIDAENENLEPLLFRAGQKKKEAESNIGTPAELYENFEDYKKKTGYEPDNPTTEPEEPKPETDAESNTAESNDKYPYVPKNLANCGKMSGSWHDPTIEDFEKEGLGWDKDATTIRSCFAAVTDGTFEGCKLPHHEPDGKANSRGVRAAWKALPKTEGISGIEDEVRAHLQKHLTNDFGEKPKSFEKDMTAKSNMGETVSKEESLKNARKKAEDEDEDEQEDNAFVPDPHTKGQPSDDEDESEGGDTESDVKKPDVTAKRNKKNKAKSDKRLESEAEGEDEDEDEAEANRCHDDEQEDNCKGEAEDKKNSKTNLARLVAREVARVRAADKRKEALATFKNALLPGYQDKAPELFGEYAENPIAFMSSHTNMFTPKVGETMLSGSPYMGVQESPVAGPLSDGTIKVKSQQLNVRLSNESSRVGESTAGHFVYDPAGSARDINGRPGRWEMFGPFNGA